MKALLVVTAFCILTFSFCLAADEVIAVSSLKIIEHATCGTPGPAGGQVPPCFTTTRISFNASTMGTCDVFSAKSNPMVAVQEPC